MRTKVHDRRQEGDAGWRPLSRCTDYPAGWYERVCLCVRDADAPLRRPARVPESTRTAQRTMRPR